MIFCLAAAALLCTGVGALNPMRGRAGHELGASLSTDPATLWPGGRLNYYIETNATITENPAPEFLAENDGRILAAVTHWEARTCLRFTRCTTLAECAQPYLRFIAAGSGCDSPVGRSAAGVNQISVSAECTIGTLISLIGRSVGLTNEQLRNDRDDFVVIDFSQIEPAFLSRFDKTGEQGRDIGPYDYNSITHSPATAFARGSQPTILAPQPIGQRSGLSDGDVATVHFMYNGCSATFAAPTCIASRAADRTHVIPHSRGWSVEFNTVYAEGNTVAVSYAQATTAPGDALAYSVPEGGSVGQVGKAVITFTPTQAHAGNTYTLGVNFTGSDGPVSGCAVTVRVAAADAVCFGVAADNPAVCGGRGTCTNNNTAAPCTCDAGFGGVECLGLADCPNNYLHSFDEDTATWGSAGEYVAVDTSFAAVGGASLRVGNPANLSENSQALLDLSAPSKPRRITFFMSRFDDATPRPFVSFTGGSDFDLCFEVGFSGAWQLNFENAQTTRAQPNRWYFFDIRVDWEAQKTDMYIDGTLQVTGRNFTQPCENGTNLVVLWEGGHYDEFHLWCTGYVLPTGPMAAGVTQDALRAGGATLTLTLVGGHDTWVDTEAAKQAVVDGMVANYPSAAGWNALRGTMLNASLVAVDGDALRVGPLRGAPDFEIGGFETVFVMLAETVFTSGAEPAWSPDELSFRISGDCDEGAHYPFDTRDEVGSTTVAVNTDTKRVGEGSLEFLEDGTGLTLPVGGTLRPASLSFYGRVVSDGLIAVSLIDGGERRIDVVLNSQGFGLTTGSAPSETFGSVEPGVWYLVEVALDWAAGTAALHVDGELLHTIPLGEFGSVANVSLASAGCTGCFIDELRLRCSLRDPVFESMPACPVPGEDAPVLLFHPGSYSLSNADTVAIVPSSVADCGNAEADCAAGGVCSSTTGALLGAGRSTEWDIGTLTLPPSTSYKVCYRPASHGEFLLLPGLFTTCEGAGAAAPEDGAPSDAPSDADAAPSDAAAGHTDGSLVGDAPVDTSGAPVDTFAAPVDSAPEDASAPADASGPVDTAPADTSGAPVDAVAAPTDAA